MARALAALFGCGATVALCSLLFPSWPGLNAVGVIVASFAAIVACVGLVVAGGRIPLAGFHVLLAVGSVCIGVAVYAGGANALSLYSPFYLLGTIYAFHFFSLKAAFAHQTFAAGGYLAVLAVTHSAIAGPAILTMVATNVLAGLAIGFLVAPVRSLAYTDQLTGLANRRAWHEALQLEVARAERDGTALCAAILDLDGLKLVNDLHGHLAGDKAISAAVNRWKTLIRGGDLLARLGGDEFGLLLPSCDPDQALHLLNRIHALHGGLTVSSGIACIVPSEPADSFVARADGALYQAKRAGRNRVVVA